MALFCTLDLSIESFKGLGEKNNITIIRQEEKKRGNT